MRILVQRVARAQVTVEGNVVGAIGRGLLLLVGVRTGDTPAHAAWLAHKVAGLRVFADAEGKMNLDLGQAGGRALAVSQFTLYADATKGNRPSYIDAARPEAAQPLFEQFCALLEAALGTRVERGVFGADMQVELVNDGPVTILLER
ncbi:MAG: D-tyrosyl-tRNA(Tyr) deacylase [Planctomycetes bacterium]|nr:D-tyrosyl-tRNA(Tyr) deacylase [Planctomycetota bacterium]